MKIFHKSFTRVGIEAATVALIRLRCAIAPRLSRKYYTHSESTLLTVKQKSKKEVYTIYKYYIYITRHAL